MQKNIDFSLITFLLLIIGNNIELEKNRMQWEELAYKISLRSDQNWKSYMGPKFLKKGKNMKTSEKMAVFS